VVPETSQSGPWPVDLLMHLLHASLPSSRASACGEAAPRHVIISEARGTSTRPEGATQDQASAASTIEAPSIIARVPEPSEVNQAADDRQNPYYRKILFVFCLLINPIIGILAYRFVRISNRRFKEGKMSLAAHHGRRALQVSIIGIVISTIAVGVTIFYNLYFILPFAQKKSHNVKLQLVE
jgi:uncharacterized membrane protein